MLMLELTVCIHLPQHFLFPGQLRSCLQVLSLREHDLRLGKLFGHLPRFGRTILKASSSVKADSSCIKIIIICINVQYTAILHLSLAHVYVHICTCICQVVEHCRAVNSQLKNSCNKNMVNRITTFQYQNYSTCLQCSVSSFLPPIRAAQSTWSTCLQHYQ